MYLTVCPLRGPGSIPQPWRSISKDFSLAVASVVYKRVSQIFGPLTVKLLRVSSIFQF